jgi:predicted amidohydrolase YtcJ
VPATGEPTGLLLEKPATLLVERLVPTPDETAQVGALVAMARRYAAAGITTIHEPAGTERDIAVYRRARAEGGLPTRVDLSWRQDSTLPIEQLEALLAAPPFDRYASGADLGVHTIKVVGDGSLSAGTAYLREPYPGRPTTRGMLIVQPDVLRRLAHAAYQHRWRLAVHASGDATLDYVLDAAEAAQSDQPALDRWVLLHHAQIPRQDQIERIRRLGAVVSTQSVFLWNKGADYHDWLADQIHQTMPLRRWLEAGVPMANSSDSPSAPYPPLLGIWHSVARVDQQGQPVGQDQALTPEEALRAYTLDGASVLRKEHDLGSISPGKLADFIALSANPLGVNTDAIHSLGVLLTVIGGQPVHQRDPFT